MEIGIELILSVVSPVLLLFGAFVGWFLREMRDIRSDLRVIKISVEMLVDDSEIDLPETITNEFNRND